MISGINGFSASLEYNITQNNINKPETSKEKVTGENLAASLTQQNQASNLDIKSMSEKEIDKLINEKMDFNKVAKTWRETMNLSENEPVNLFRYFSLSGYTADKEPKVSIWGKLKGFDKSMGSEEIADLKKFIDDSKALGIGMRFFPQERIIEGKKIGYSIAEFTQEWTTEVGLLLRHDKDEGIALLDSDLSIEEFKEKWMEYAAKQRLGLDMSEGKPLAMPKIEQFAREKEDDKKQFKPIQGKSDNKTYTREDTAKAFFLNFLKTQQENGVDILTLLEKIGGISKVDKRI